MLSDILNVYVKNAKFLKNKTAYLVLQQNKYCSLKELFIPQNYYIGFIPYKIF